MKKYDLGFIADAASGWVAEDDGRRIRFCIEMQDRLLRDRRSVCLLVNTRAAPRDAAFTCRLEGRTFTQELIREVSSGRLREVVQGQ